MSKFLKKLRERTEKNAVKSVLSWTDNSGKVHTEEVILKRSKIPLVGDWARIYPAIKEDVPETEKWWKQVHWINAVFGGKKNFIRTLIVLAIIGLFLLGYYEQFHNYELLKESCVQIINP